MKDDILLKQLKEERDNYLIKRNACSNLIRGLEDQMSALQYKSRVGECYSYSGDEEVIKGYCKIVKSDAVNGEEALWIEQDVYGRITLRIIGWDDGMDGYTKITKSVFNKNFDKLFKQITEMVKL